MDKLNAKQEMFCREYLIDLNATQAAIRAGYSARSASVTGARLLANAKIIAYVRDLKDKRADELELDAYWVLKRLKDISNRSMQAEPVMKLDSETREMVETGEYEFDSNGANRATELIGRHIGMFDPKLLLQKEMMKAQTEKVKVETSLIKTYEKDTSMLDALVDGRKEYEKLLKERENNEQG